MRQWALDAGIIRPVNHLADLDLNAARCAGGGEDGGHVLRAWGKRVTGQIAHKGRSPGVPSLPGVVCVK